MNWMSVTYDTWRTWQGRWKKSRMTLTVFFSKWKKEQWQSFDFNQNVAILGKYNMPFELMLQLPVSVLAYDNEDCQGHQFLLWKHQDQCLVTVSCKTFNIALKLSKFTKWNYSKIRGSSKSAPPSDVLWRSDVFLPLFLMFLFCFCYLLK